MNVTAQHGIGLILADPLFELDVSRITIPVPARRRPGGWCMMNPEPLLRPLLGVLRPKDLDPAAHRGAVPPWAYREKRIEEKEREGFTRNVEAMGVQDTIGYFLPRN